MALRGLSRGLHRHLHNKLTTTTVTFNQVKVPVATLQEAQTWRQRQDPEDTLMGLFQSLKIKELELSSKYILAGVNPSPILDPGINRTPWISPLNREIISPTTPSNVQDPLRNPPPAVEDAPDNHRSHDEKQAARLIVIRRIKMNKHKLKKLRKKMRFHDLKVKERRYVRREKAYLDEKMALITAARKFDAKEYVASIIKRAKEEPVPRKWTDPLMPEWFREQEMDKERRLNRYQKVINQYLNQHIKLKKP